MSTKLLILALSILLGLFWIYISHGKEGLGKIFIDGVVEARLNNKEYKGTPKKELEDGVKMFTRLMGYLFFIMGTLLFIIVFLNKGKVIH